MNPGICYVYEYENKQRRRNVGFLKITKHYQSCILQIHVRGLPVGNGAALDLCAFYLHGQEMIGVPVASLTCFARSVSARLPISESHFPEHRSLSGIDGFLIRLPGSRDSVFWAASENSFDADLSHLRPPEDENDAPADEEQPDAPLSEENPEGSRHDGEPAPQVSEQRSAPPAQDCESPSARKIERSEISKLPRRFWFLANNSFLLHGYHNYNHLLLVEEDGHVWLGVPGIYDIREARAADLFGFPNFTRSYVPMLGLSKDERNDEADFGHWCRCLDSGRPAR